MVADITEYLSSLKGSAKFGPQVVFQKKSLKVRAKYAENPPELNKPLLDILKQSGISKLYTHQQHAIDAIKKGRNVIVATPTASGKSMIYNLPVLDDLFNVDPGHSLYLFPLKALAQDQHNVLNTLFLQLPEDIQRKNPYYAALFDGDTSSYMRRKIREKLPRVILTNPEMLHLSLLPYHQNWSEFFGKLRYVVIDEVHSYRGILGSHMAWVLRRLQRIASHYGANPTFILLSATIGNPKELGQLLLDSPAKVFIESGAPQPEKQMVFLNPWDSAAYTASQLLEAAIKRGLRTIVYTQSRKMTELINIWTSPRLGKLASKLSSYRAGFLPEERREIEGMLFSGKLLGVISTSALELGIDIGDLDLCILVGYPGSIMSTLQRGGRVGRGHRKSATILIGQEDALDQHFMKNPEDFFRRTPESAVLNPANTTIMDQHLHCCAAELPLSAKEAMWAQQQFRERVRQLAQSGVLLEIASGGQWISTRKYPQRHVSLRGGGTTMSIIDGERGEIVGEMDTGRGMKECHPGAVYIHRATTWVITTFDLLAGEIIAHKKKPHYFTRPTSEKRTEILHVISKKSVFGTCVSFGMLKVTEKVTGYQKRNTSTHKLIATVPLEMPEQTIETEGLWFDIPDSTVRVLEENKYHFMGAIHAMEHAVIALFPLIVLCDRNDIGGISCPLHEQTEQASVFIYDGYAGGVGLCKDAYEKIESLLLQSQASVASCECDTGCPSCVHSPKCGSGNRPIDKRACLYLFEKVLDHNAQENKAIIQSGGSQQNLPKTKRVEDVMSVVSGNLKSGLDVLPDRFGVFDLETIRSAEEVGGWGQTHKMGISVGVVFDSELNDCVSYLEHEIDQLIDHLYSLDLVVGFNNKRFDNRVLSAYTTCDLNLLPSLDLLEEVHNYLGYRLSLNRLAEHTLGTKKSADGLQALKWYKEGRIDLIQHYCKKDVEITRDLFIHGLEQGFFLFANKAKQKVRLPLALDATIARILKR